VCETKNNLLSGTSSIQTVSLHELRGQARVIQSVINPDTSFRN